MLRKMKKERCRIVVQSLAIVVFAMTLSACGKKQGAEGGGGMPPPAIGYVTAQKQNVGLTEEHPGRLEAYRVADVRARVAGVLLSRKFEEGSDVKAGQLLFQIDDEPYKATLQSAQAQLAQARASLMQSKSQADRLKPLVAVNAVSQQSYDDAVAAQKVSEANIAAANAAIKSAQINLDYAAVTSPINGRIGRSLVTEGALVGQSGVATELAVVQQIDKLYVNFTQTAEAVINMRRAIAAGKLKSAGADGSLPVTIILDDGSEYEQKGKLLFTDLTVDQSTGQVTLRATVNNPDGLLLPGLYVRVRLDQMQADDAFLVPQSAVSRGAVNRVKVINADDVVEEKEIVIAGRKGNAWLVTAGLENGDRIMIDGEQKWQMALQGLAQAMAAQGVTDIPPLKVTPVPRDQGVATSPDSEPLKGNEE